MQETFAIEIDGLKKAYGSVQALRGVNLAVRRGEILGFLGPNGAGKTTTIRCLLDLIRPDAGTIRVLGLDPAADPVAVRRRVGYLPGELSLEANLSTEGMLRYLDDLRGRRVDWTYLREVAERLELDLALPIKNLSRGNKQKAGVVQALMSRPELLLLDEPTSGLDPLMQQEVYRLLHEAQAGGATVFFSSHIISEVEAIAERVAIIRQGAIAEELTPSRLVNMSLRRIRVRFKEAVDPEPLLQVKGVSLVSRDDGTGITVQIEGEVDRLIKALAAFPVSDIQTENPSLEEVFMSYYEGSKQEET